MKKYLLPAAVFSVLALSACASTPDPGPEPVAESVPQAPAPVPVVPAPAPEIDRSAIAPPVPQPRGPVPGSVDDFIHQTGGDARVYFGYDRYDLTAQAADTLRLQADWLNTYSTVTAVIEGNADERGTREYNLALGARRAAAVKDFLVSQGVAPNRLTTVSYGKERPVDPRSNEDGWARNRNGHTNLMTGTSS
ncbi:MAG: peptidoglycan-associated lipoprotein Pal [Hyphomonadaceae bacterium]|nr:peptidoglycan-associated lipoprotein Pal [Hyphomonadaceae bacterium]MBC6412471.1 peptidoglycan-associated lipoprotein Pal [Hyphomonadaceae bacterium]